VLPPELLNNDPNGFAWGVWHDRTPRLVAQIRDAHPYGPPQRRLRLCTHEFYCAPWDYRRMPADLASEFAVASLTILKGDLNYRRLVGDRAWPAATPFAEVVSYFPGQVAVLRTLKSDVVTGLSPDTVAELDATGQPWRTDGSHGLIQLPAAG
jgi:hypothetical protein